MQDAIQRTTQLISQVFTEPTAAATTPTSISTSAPSPTSPYDLLSPIPAMKALILVGGYGTRLRPLTFSQPKPLVPFCNLPIVLHQIQALVAVGVKHVVLAVNVQPDAMISFIERTAKELSITIEMSQETVPLGTAGPLALAREHLLKDNEPFFMLNSDVICDFPLRDMLNYHISHGGEGTILVTEVQDPSKYGVVVSDSRGKILSFVEKPQVFVSNKINAGIYLFNVEILRRIELKPTSIERDIFPHMAAENRIYSMPLQGYWMDVGQPKDFIAGTSLHLAYVRKNDPRQLVDNEASRHVHGNVMIDKTAKVSSTAQIGPDVVIGPGVVVEDGARVKYATLMEGSRVAQHAYIQKTIIGWHGKIGAWARVNNCVFGEDVTVAAETAVSDTVVCPHKEVKEDTIGKTIL